MKRKADTMIAFVLTTNLANFANLKKMLGTGTMYSREKRPVIVMKPHLRSVSPPAVYLVKLLRG